LTPVTRTHSTPICSILMPDRSATTSQL
jgi:hypothetical protein